MTLLLVAHGTRDPAGTTVIEALAARVRHRLPGARVSIAYADVRQPNVTTALRHLPRVQRSEPASPTLRTRESPVPARESPVLDRESPVVVVPAFLVAGYHVRVDIPGQIRRSGRRAILTRPLGTAAVPAAYARLLESGWRRGDPVVLAAAGSSDRAALAEVGAAAERLGRLVGGPVHVGYTATAAPRIADVVAGIRGRVAVASWLLAPGRFHQVAARSGAATVAAPIGDHSLVADLVAARYHAAGIIEPATTLVGA